MAALALLTPIPQAGASSAPSTSVVEAALCIHSGWHYSHLRHSGMNPEYVLWGHGYWRTSDVPDSLPGGSGEGGWTATSDPRYGGGLSFTVGTYNRAGRPYVASTAQIAAASPREQIRRLTVIVAQDGGSFREWPQTSRACGLR